MMKTRVFSRAAMCVTFFALTVICVGCSQNNPPPGGGGDGHRVGFKGRTCPVNATSEDYPIEVVANRDVFRDPASNAIVVCEGDKVSWFIQSGSGVITINFTDPYANDLFGQSNFHSAASGSTNQIAKQTVKSQKEHPGRVYKYTIEVKDSGNTYTKDPHIIPM
jgi:hypothetical protein